MQAGQRRRDGREPGPAFPSPRSGPKQFWQVTPIAHKRSARSFRARRGRGDRPTSAWVGASRTVRAAGPRGPGRAGWGHGSEPGSGAGSAEGESGRGGGWEGGLGGGVGRVGREGGWKERGRMAVLCDTQMRELVGIEPFSDEG